jgi:ribosomal protein S18 acetylase RimI-like enzyme
MKITIRNAKLTDAKTIADFNYSIAAETEHIVLDRKRLLRGVKALLKDDSKGFYILAEVGGRVAGQLMITYEWSDWRCATFWWIQSVYVSKEFRGAGVFKHLYRHIKKRAKKNKLVCGLRLYVERSNSRAQQTYEHLGMRKADYNLYEIDFVIKRSGKSKR